ncbi:MAG TPA: hypothetical protein PKH75_10110 [Bacillota bacterium]|mgnify:FL=1|jgi:hypothetical protein|nr:hypothetical protein [Bacillota bacterium]
MMLSPDVVGLVGLFLAIGGQYALLFKIYGMVNGLEIELATCPWHRTGRKPAVGDEP